MLVVLSATFLDPAAVRAASEAAGSPVCQANNEMFKQGERTCLDISGGPRPAQCSMVLNNSSWRMLEGACTPDVPDAPPAEEDEE